MKKFERLLLLCILLISFTQVQAEDLSEDQLIGLCMVAAGNVAEGSVKGLNDRDSIKKAKVVKRAIVLAKREQGKDPRKIFANESEFNVTNNYFVNLSLADKKMYLRFATHRCLPNWFHSCLKRFTTDFT